VIMGRGRGGLVPRGRGVVPAPRGRGSMMARGRGVAGRSMAGAARGAGVGRGRGNLGGKRKFDGGHQNQGDTKRRYPNSSWGNAPIPQQPLDSAGYGNSYGGGAGEWYQDSYGQQWG